MPGVGSTQGAPKPRLLIVDDEPGMTQLLARILKSSYTVAQESDPRRVVGRLEAGERFDLVLCDLMMPPMGGLDLYDAVVHVAPELAARFMLMTGGVTNPELGRRVAAWRHGVLYKPFNIADVGKLVAAKLERLRGEPMQHEATIG